MHCVMWWVPLRYWFSKFSCLLFILGAFAKLREASISFSMSVCLSVGIEQNVSHWMDFKDMCDFLVFFEITSRKFKVHYYLTRTTGTLHEDRGTFLIISCPLLLPMRNFLSKFVETCKTHILCSKAFILEILALCEIMW